MKKYYMNSVSCLYVITKLDVLVFKYFIILLKKIAFMLNKL